MPVRWAGDVSGSFRVTLNVEITYQHGALAELTKAVACAHASIDDIGISERSGDYCLVSLRLLVKNLSHLKRVLRYVGNASVVTGVVRKK